MLRLQPEQIDQKMAFIQDYLSAANAADGSKMDANANVTQKNIATLESELMKDFFVQVNRKQVSTKIAELFGEELGAEYIRQIEDHEIYVHDETSLKPYCVSVTMYPFLRDGLTKLGGESLAPKHLESFCGTFVNFVFAVSSQFAGAVATVEFLAYFDYFARKDYGDDYLRTHRHQIENHLQHVVYALNQPAAARGYQSVFWNISIYDQHYFDSMFGDFVFPDFSRASWQSVSRLQEFFLNWFNDERKKTILTFPVVTVAMLTEEGQCKDHNFASQIAGELAQGNSFFVYLSDNADSLASCCRLRSEISDNTFSYTLGAGGVATGSINVITINMNRLVQDGRDLATEIDKIQKYQVAYRRLMESYLEAGLLTVYDAGFISLEKQFLTIGINGMVEAAESQGLVASNNPDYIEFVQRHLKVIYDANKVAKKTYGYMFNTEFVPAENLGVKNAKWDREDGYFVPRDCYNSYFYVVEDDQQTNSLDKFILHGSELTDYLDGGSALHLNLDEKLTQDGYLSMLNIAAQTGCNYFCVNVKITICNACEHIDKRTLASCSACGSADIDYGTRVIGYLKRVSAFSAGRRKEHQARHYHRKKYDQSIAGATAHSMVLRRAS
ncbi:ribonucleoside-triphosphate reductase [Pseudidiomarina salinarum]|uniref:Ribonucleoside-triphosphate reductase n=1 Tax=Pseudidiomarina salinarum TaxID=435908 RepID=A0A094JDU7_9GAMM|nr:anaerobic ribonucleoside-triphosphate reductase [Pseudidiomarina salinarum]KFZ30731.1 ribonucleoside-triphosphate reductase [Pseudidiomarina salinarum]RUO69250.1 anaerobic ribonucleoside-triphosphate reductase [Pseudidiomarina salinarum]